MPPVPIYHCVGSGNYIANYVHTAAGYRRFSVTMKDAIPMALHMVTAARRHDFGSGGGPQFMFIWGMTSSGLMAWESDRSGDYIRDFEYAAGYLLSSIGNARLTEQQFEAQLSDFTSKARRLRSESLSPGSPYMQLIQASEKIEGQ